MKNISAGTYAVVANKTAAFSSLYFTTLNTAKIYEVDGQYKSWRPGRALNAVDGIVSGRGYIIVASAPIDISDGFDVVSVIKSIGILNICNQNLNAVALNSSNEVIQVIKLCNTGQITNILESEFEAITGAAKIGFYTLSGSKVVVIDLINVKDGVYSGISLGSSTLQSAEAGFFLSIDFASFDNLSFTIGHVDQRFLMLLDAANVGNISTQLLSASNAVLFTFLNKAPGTNHGRALDEAYENGKVKFSSYTGNLTVKKFEGVNGQLTETNVLTNVTGDQVINLSDILNGDGLYIIKVITTA